MEKVVSEMMLKEHERIDELLKELEACLGCSDVELERIFNKFKWTLEKHFFLEEKAVFGLYDKIEGQEVSDTFDLMQEHGDILEIMKMFEENLSSTTPNVLVLKEKLKKHVEFEDSTFYPRLDKSLSEQQKQEIIERTKEIIRE